MAERLPKKVSRGDPMEAAQQNRIRALAAALLPQPRTVGLTPRPWSHSMRHEITAIFGNYLECVRMWRGSDVGTEIVYVARPELLRVSVTSRDGVSYSYSDAQTRTASKAGETNELQLVTPNYLVGDVIEVEVVRALTGIATVDEQRGRPIDKNLDGRAWATVPPAP